MDWNAIGTQIILGIIGVIISGIGLIVTYLINKYVKNDKLKTIISNLHDLVGDCVQETYQVYVQELKDKNMFDKEAQKKALEMCLAKIENQMPKEIEDYLNENFDDVKAYLITLIESMIASLKIIGK